MYLLKCRDGKFNLLEYAHGGLIRVPKNIFEWCSTHCHFLKQEKENLQNAMQEKKGLNNQHNLFIGYDNQNGELYYSYLNENFIAMPLTEAHLRITNYCGGITMTQLSYNSLIRFKTESQIYDSALLMMLPPIENLSDLIKSLKNKKKD